jgi:DNA-binding XRE family transcriptional regulator
MRQGQRFPPDWNITDFHQRLRQLRMARKVTQTRLAELLGASPRVYTRWENGDATPLFGCQDCRHPRCQSRRVGRKEGNQRRYSHPQPGVAPPLQESRSALR